MAQQRPELSELSQREVVTEQMCHPVCSSNQFCAVHLTIITGRAGSDAIEALRRGEQAAEAHRRPRQSADQDADDRGQGADTRTGGGTTD